MSLNTAAVPEFSFDSSKISRQIILSARSDWAFAVVVAMGVGKFKEEQSALNGDRITQVNLSFDSPEELHGKILQVGKKRFIKLVSE